ncbi:MAG: DUF2231 domain-containing protein [Hyphomicrobiales bacterium]|nr:DUF2231 domain-containing protein [Hyphomicrobiales bacterium]
MANPRTTASIAGHPVHPMLVPFPIAFFVAAFLCDLAYWQSAAPGWATAALWLVGAGLAAAAAAAVAGVVDFLGERAIRATRDAWWHGGGNVLVVLIEAYNWYLRYAQGAEAVIPTGLALSALATVLLLFTGWKGGELVFRHRVGVLDDPEAAQSRPQPAPRRAA